MATSCSAEDGTDGIDGTDGVDGTQGPAGEDGNANVISTGWFRVQKDYWNGPGNGSHLGAIDGFYAYYDVYTLSAEQAENASVLIYVRKVWGQINMAFLCPFSFQEKIGSNNLIKGRVKFTFTYGAGEDDAKNIWLHVLLMSGSWNQTWVETYYLSNYLEWRVVVIPPVTTTTTLKDIDLNNYKAVAKVLNLQP